MSENTQKYKPIILKSLFIIMILVIIVLLAFAVIRFIPFMFSSFASVGSSVKSPFSSDVEIRLSENDLNSNEAFRLYWEYKGSKEGTFNLNYECAPNLGLVVVDENNTELKCDTNYPLSASDKFIDLKAVSARENTYTESKISVAYIDGTGEEVSSASEAFSVTNEGSAPVNDLSGSATISSQGVNTGGGDTSNNDNVDTDDSTNSNTPNNNQTVSNVPADLAIFNARAISDTIVVFDVTNIGGRSSGNWNFSYTIPGEGLQTSPLQLSLTPGATIRYTLTFDDIPSGNAVISVDPTNSIRENSETNNITTVFVRGDGGNGDSSDNNYDSDDEADLVIRNLEAGYMSGSRFREDDDIDERDDAAIRFEVVNIGGESTGTWRFEIDGTPYDDSNNDYRSGRQSSLRPGESRIITVEFENPDAGRYNIEVEVDSDDDVDEENERNNDDSVRLRVRD